MIYVRVIRRTGWGVFNIEPGQIIIGSGYHALGYVVAHPPALFHNIHIPVSGAWRAAELLSPLELLVIDSEDVDDWSKPRDSDFPDD